MPCTAINVTASTGVCAGMALLLPIKRRRTRRHRRWTVKLAASTSVRQAVQILVTSPLIGRPVKGGKRELVIGRASRGYVALYRYVADIDTVFVLAIRSQRESGYKRDR